MGLKNKNKATIVQATIENCRMKMLVGPNPYPFSLFQAMKKASQEAELQRMKDVAMFQQELEKKKNLEEELRRQAASQPKTVTIPDGELANELEMWKRKSLKQETQITRSEI